MDLNEYLKYSATQSDVDNLLKQLAENADHSQAGSVHRLVTADALQEQGREPEAHLLRSEHPIYVRNGKVYHAHGGNQKSPPHSPYMTPLERMQRDYKIAALWASTDDYGHPLDDDYNWQDFDPATYKQMDSDCEHFFHSNQHLLGDATPEQVGHDFWLSRNGHGAGFLDGEEHYGASAPVLQQAAKEAGPYHLDPVYHDNDETTRITGYGGSKKWGQPEGLHEQR